MARLDIAIEHGLSPEDLQNRFEQAIRENHTLYPKWIHRLKWANDSRSVMVTGPGYEVRCWHDAREVHVQGSIPLAWKLFESVIRNHIKRDIDRSKPNPAE